MREPQARTEASYLERAEEKLLSSVLRRVERLEWHMNRWADACMRFMPREWVEAQGFVWADAGMRAPLPPRRWSARAHSRSALAGVVHPPLQPLPHPRRASPRRPVLHPDCETWCLSACAVLAAVLLILVALSYIMLAHMLRSWGDTPQNASSTTPSRPIRPHAPAGVSPSSDATGARAASCAEYGPVHEEIDGMTALMRASSQGDEVCAVELIKAGASVDARDSQEGFTALLMASAMGERSLPSSRLLSTCRPPLGRNGARPGPVRSCAACSAHPAAASRSGPACGPPVASRLGGMPLESCLGMNPVRGPDCPLGCPRRALERGAPAARGQRGR